MRGLFLEKVSHNITPTAIREITAMAIPWPNHMKTRQKRVEINAISDMDIFIRVLLHEPFA
jgi:hypothetical protein